MNRTAKRIMGTVLALTLIGGSGYVGEGKYPTQENLSFMNFPVAATVTTYDSTSICPDSASTATSLSTGEKTLSSVINYDGRGR